MSEIQDYLAHGWALVAIPPGQKGPNTKGWNLRGAPFVARIGWGVGLCHAYSGTCALDVDEYELAREWFAEHGMDLDALMANPFSVRIHSGRPNRAKLLFKLTTPLPSLKLAPYVVKDQATGKDKTYHAFELRCATKDGTTVQDVLPPSIHPTTLRPYEWQYADELMADWRNLPELPAALLDLWRVECDLGAVSGDLPPAAQVTPYVPVAPSAELTQLAKLLETLDPDLPYDGGEINWLTVGAIIHYETKGSREGLLLWNSWSAKGTKYEGIDDLEPHWRSFHTDSKNPKTVASLIAAQPKAASVDEFTAVSPDTAVGEDMRLDAVMRRLLETRLVQVSGQDQYFDMITNTWLTDHGVKHTFCPYVPSHTQQGKNGKPDKVIRPDPVKWLMESDTKSVVQAVAVRPGADRIFTQGSVKYANRYTPIVVEPLRPKPYETEAFEFLWSRIKDRDIAKWLLKFYAHALQKPGVKITSAPLLFSEKQGTGKNTICRVIPELLFGARWVTSMTCDVLSSSFSDPLAKTWWLYMEELRSGESKSERLRLTNKMKPWVTDPYIEVHPKGLSAHTIPNYLQLTATSNHADAIHVDEDDRRWAVAEMKPPMSEREAVDLYGFLESPRASGVLHHIFKNISTVGFSPTARAPKSLAKKAMIRAGIGSWESVLVERMVAGEPPFDRDMFTQQMVRDNVMFRGAAPTPVGLGRILARSPFNCEPLQGQGEIRYLAWRNIAQWAKYRAEQRATYVASGVRPLGIWTDAIPEGIQDMSADGALDLSEPNEIDLGVDESLADLF